MKNLFKKLGTALVVGATGSMAYAADHSATITAAGTDGETNLGAAVTAVIAIVAVVVGVGMVISFLRKT